LELEAFRSLSRLEGLLIGVVVLPEIRDEDRCLHQYDLWL